VAGDSFEVTLSPEQGFGARDDKKVIEVEAGRLPEGIKPGDSLQMQTPQGQVVPVALLSIDDGKGTLDANHPLAGKTVLFKVKVLEVLHPKA
jgi:FKBP-type peptidyl-prolyl cis-trans isomerase 2